MSERTHNRWMTDIKGKVHPVLAAYSSSDLPTYLVIGGNRIPFLVKDVKVVDGASPDHPEIELHIDCAGLANTEWIVETEGALGAILHAEEKLKHAKDRLVALRQGMNSSVQETASQEEKSPSVQDRLGVLRNALKAAGRKVESRPSRREVSPERQPAQDKDMLTEMSEAYELAKPFHGEVEGFSPLEAEVNRSLCALVCVIDGYDYFTVSSRFNECFPVVEDYAKSIGLPVYSNADGYEEWEKKTFYEISTDIQSVANDLCAATKVTFTPDKDEFVVLLSVDKDQYLSQKAPLTGTVREYIKSRFPKCSLMVYPSVCQNNEELIAITKVDGKYFCARRYGI